MKLSELAERQVIAPESEAELVSVVTEATRHGRRILPIGRGTQLTWCGVPEATDLLVSTECLSGIVSHVPEDGTIAVRAGTTLEEVRDAARRGGHFLTPDAPEPQMHTIGGLLAAGQSGPDRLRFGPARDHVLGMRVLLADGTVARSGGQLVKNVTGYDLHRLYCGSHGSLCVILEVALRLFPEPEDELYLVADVRGQRELLGCASAVRGSNVRPLSLSVERSEEPSAHGDVWRAHLRLAGMSPVLDQERAVLEHALPNEVELRTELRGPEARAAFERTRDRMWSHRAGPYLRVTSPPSDLPAILSELGSSAPGHPVWIDPGLASVEVGDAPDSPGGLAGLGAALAERFDGHRHVTVDQHGPGSGPWPSLNARTTGLEMMRALKQRLDPGGLFARQLLP